MTVRIWAALACLVFAVLLGWVAAKTLGPGELVTPRVALKEAKPAEGNGQASPSATLARRTQLQAEASVACGEQSAALEQPGGALKMQPSATDGRGAVRDWLKETPDESKLLQQPSFKSGVSSLPYREAQVLVQPQGRDFRRRHNDDVRYSGGWAIFGVSLALALFLFGRGRIEIAEGESGETVQRFNFIERGTHWMTATAFLLMALTGLVILYGKPLLLPLLGSRAFGTLAAASAWLHMASAVPFVLGIVLMAAMWIKDNVPTRLDWEWLKRGGGFLRHDGRNPPARRFNAGQKLVFWGVLLGGLAMLATGALLMFPFYWLGYTGMQWTQIAHAGIGIAMIALILGHIYIGTVGMVGAFAAMWSGLVDRNWAREHHSLWLAGRQGTGRADSRPAE